MSRGKNILGILAATAVGVGLGVLFAPDKGSATRKRYKEEADRTKDKFKEDAENLKKDVSETITEQKDVLGNKINETLQYASRKADTAIDNVEEFLKGLKEKNKEFQAKQS